MTGTRLWDIPKGVAETGETAVEAALRELSEETGLALQADQLTLVDTFSYLPSKSLTLFVTPPLAPEPALDTLSCRSMMTRFGTPAPEVDGYRWVERHLLQDFCGQSLTRVLLMSDW